MKLLYQKYIYDCLKKIIYAIKENISKERTSKRFILKKMIFLLEKIGFGSGKKPRNTTKTMVALIGI